MSNIFTAAVRVFARPGDPIDRGAAESILQRMHEKCGSYRVPVTAALGPDGGYLDIQTGSGKNPYAYDFWETDGDRYAGVWLRFGDEGRVADTVRHLVGPGDLADEPDRSCRYGFDSVVVTGQRAALPEPADWSAAGAGRWRLEVAGSYLTHNDRSDRAAGPIAMPGPRTWDLPRPARRAAELATPTTPADDDSGLAGVAPRALAPLFGGQRPDPRISGVDLLWRGRVVHRIGEYPDWIDDAPDAAPTWQHRSADGWDNCVDPDYLAFVAARAAA